MEWISVKDRLPEDEKDVLFTWSGWIEMGYLSNGSIWRDGEGYVYEPTHWMPLPPPPEEP